MIYKVLVGDEHGGAAVASCELINAFLDKGDDFKAVFLSEGRFSRCFQSDNVSVLKSGCPPIIQSPSKIQVLLNYLSFLFWLFKATLNLRQFIKKNKVKYIHTNNNHALLVCLLCKCFSSDLYIMTHWRCVGLVSTSNYKKLLSKIDKIIAISNAVKDSLPHDLQEKARVIYDGMDVEDLYTKNIVNRGKLRKILNLSDGVFLIGTIGSYTIIKCHELIIDSMASANDTNCHAVLFGSTPNVESEKYLKYLKEKVSKYKLESRVHFVDNTIIEMPREYISDMDLFVGATWNNGLGEGFGLIYIEAMSAQLPVVAINVGAVGEIISDETNGFLIEKNSSDELWGKISHVMNSNNLKNIRIAAFERAKEFDISITINNIKSIYNKLK